MSTDRDDRVNAAAREVASVLAPLPRESRQRVLEGVADIKRIQQTLRGLTPEQLEVLAQRMAVSNGYSIEESRKYIALGERGELFNEIDRIEAELEKLKLNHARVRAITSVYVPPNKPWMWALEMKIAALKTMEIFTHDTSLTDVARGFAFDQIAMLKGAEAYSWSADASTAALLASRSISEDTLPSEIVVPGMAGWWWFLDPLPVKTTPDGYGLAALLWAKKDHGLEFSTFVMSKSGIVTSLGWIWDPAITWSELMAGMVGQDYLLRTQSDLPIEEGRVAIGQISRLFLAGCVWLNQKVAAVESGHVERHRQKQIIRETPGIDVEAPIRVVQLRRREAPSTTPMASGDGAPVEWSCRWVVSGHWRNQFYRSSGERKLVYIMPFVKGPADKPFKAVAQTVYEVNR